MKHLKIATLPEEFLILSDQYRKNPLWEKYIEWLNTKYNTSYSGRQDGCYYGPYKGNTVFSSSLISTCPVISIYQWYAAINNVPDFTLEGTELGTCYGLEYAPTDKPHFNNSSRITTRVYRHVIKPVVMGNEIGLVISPGPHLAPDCVVKLDDVIKLYRTSKEVASKMEFSTQEAKIAPTFYRWGPEEIIEMMASIWGIEKTADFCTLEAFKCRMEMGVKPDQPSDLEQDLKKEQWYSIKSKELKERLKNG